MFFLLSSFSAVLTISVHSHCRYSLLPFPLSNCVYIVHSTGIPGKNNYQYNCRYPGYIRNFLWDSISLQRSPTKSRIQQQQAQIANPCLFDCSCCNRRFPLLPKATYIVLTTAIVVPVLVWCRNSPFFDFTGKFNSWYSAYIQG